MPQEILCFALCRAIPISLCAAFTGIASEQISHNTKDNGYCSACHQCELVQHGAILSEYSKQSPARLVFQQHPALLDELYRTAHECYLMACPQCNTVYRALLTTYPEEHQDQVASCLKCGTALNEATSCEFVEISL